MDSLGEDLILLSIRPEKGTLATIQRIGFGLMGSELVRLAATGRIDIQKGRILVLNHAATGDAELDVALGSLARSRRPARATQWVGHPRRGILDTYLRRLMTRGVVRPERRFLRKRYFIADPARAADARVRLDAIAHSSGMIDTGQAAFGGLAHAVGLGDLLYRGRGARPLRKRLAEVAKGQWTAAAVSQAGADAARSAAAATEAAAQAATRAAMQAASQAAMQAATQAAAQAATQAATDAAIHASHHQAASHHHGGAGGHH
jgi:pyruvate/2-oxoglutarate dehydrogenase complex dihydrolipoamide acyltransferase (E2) component